MLEPDGQSVARSETNTRKRFLCVPNFQPPRIVHRFESWLETILEPSSYLIRREPRNGLAHALGTSELEQRAFLPGVFQNAFIHIQGDVTQEYSLVRAQWNVSDRVL